MLHPGHTARPRTCTAAAAAFLFAVLAIVRETGASLTTHKGADSYEFDGATKPGE
jgi:hypothetical protein